MLYYLFPFRLKNISSHTTPKGPGAWALRRSEVQMGGVNLAFDAPKHFPHMSVLREFPLERNVDLDQQTIFDSKFDYENWSEGTLFSRHWRFVGPLFTGSLANLQMVLKISKWKKPIGGSLFEPSLLKSEILGYISDQYESGKFWNKDSWIVPSNWSTRSGKTLPIVNYDVVPKTGAQPFLSEFVIPIRWDCLLTVSFDQEQLMGGSLESRDAMIDRGPMIKLMNQIMDSMEFELSPEISAEVCQYNYDSIALLDIK